MSVLDSFYSARWALRELFHDIKNEFPFLNLQKTNSIIKGLPTIYFILLTALMDNFLFLPR